MELVVITAENIFPGEVAALNRLFGAGMPLLHLRKPGARESELRGMIEGVDEGFRQRIVLHDHFRLAPEYGLKGVHLNSRNPRQPELPVGHVSRSCHSLTEVEAAGGNYDYVFLSPVFDSISKTGYGSAFTREELARAKQQGIINEKVYALGGVDEKTMPLAARTGFGGAAILGSLWKDYQESQDIQALEKRLARFLVQARGL